MAEGALRCVLKIYTLLLILMSIGIGAVTSYRNDEESKSDSVVGTVLDWAGTTQGKMVIGGTVAAGVSVAAAPVAVAALGFTSAGIAAKSVAAYMMSYYAGAIPAAGVFATLQSIGATGTVLGSTVATAVTGTFGGLAGAAVVKAASDSNDNDRE